MSESIGKRPTTRRTFLKNSAAVLLGVTGASLLQGCGTAPAPEPTKPAAGAAAAGPTSGLATAAVASTGVVKKGGELIFGHPEPTASLEPHLETLDARTQRTVLIYENLTSVDYDMKPQPQLAESWENPDPLTFIFKLRQGVKFFNGKEMDAEDVKYSYERVMDPKVGSGGRGDLILIDKIDAVDKYTVKITMKQPHAALLAALGGRYCAVIPKDFIKTGNELRMAAMGTGPYMVESFDPNDKLVLKKFPDYWDKNKGYLDRIVIQYMPDESSIVAGLRTGVVGMAKLLDPKNYTLVKDDKRLVSSLNPALRWVVFDMVGSPPPFDTVEFRLAVQLAVDRPGALETVGRGLGDLLGVLPPALKPYALSADQLPNQKRDVAKAKELLAKAGVAPGTSIKLRVITGSQIQADAAQFVAANLLDIGINVNIEAVDSGVWGNDWINGTTPPVINPWGGFTDPDLAFFRHFHSRPDGMDFRRWNNKEADQLLEEGRTTLDPAKRKPIYDQFQKLIATEAISIPLWAPSLIYTGNTWVKGYKSHATGFLYGLAETWLDKAG